MLSIRIHTQEKKKRKSVLVGIRLLNSRFAGIRGTPHLSAGRELGSADNQVDERAMVTRRTFEPELSRQDPPQICFAFASGALSSHRSAHATHFGH